MSDTRRRLDQLAARRRPAPRTPPTAPPKPVATALPDVLPGRELTFNAQHCWNTTTNIDDICQPHSLFPTAFTTPCNCHTGRESATINPPQTLIIDIETGGFAGTPVFLIGILHLGTRPFQVIQFLARDYPEESAILHALNNIAQSCDTWVSFNGRSFDEPFLRDRATLHRVPLPTPRLHLDILHAARRRWRHTLPNCRLTTLEQHLLNRRRVGDVPSSDVPDLFHYFIHTGNAAPLAPVLLHNRIDLLSSAELLLRLTDSSEVVS